MGLTLPSTGMMVPQMNIHGAASLFRILFRALIPAAIAGLAFAQRPNVIYILADDLGYGDLSSYGQQKLATPHIDRLAVEGLRFTQHYTGNTVCTPSRAVLMTGQQPGTVYVRGNLGQEANAALDPAMTVLPEIFKAAGYATGAFGKWGLGETHRQGPENPLVHGFDTFSGWKNQLIAHTYYPSTMVKDGVEIPLEAGTYIHDLIMDDAFRFIDTNAKSGQPFFCYIPTAIPHAAMHAPPEIHQKWRERFPQFDHLIGRYGAGPGEDCPDVVNPIAGFAAMMEVLDRDVGRLLDLLDELGIADNTLVMFSSDNGPHREGGHDPDFWNSGGDLRGLKRDMHEGGIRVPLLARWPGVIEAGRTTDHISAFWDMMPTFSELLGRAPPLQADGISMMPTLRGAGGQREHAHLYFEFSTGPEQRTFSQAVRMGKWKAYSERGGPFELYDLSIDPDESQDLAKNRPDVVRQIRAAIDEATAGRAIEFVTPPLPNR